MVEAMATRRAVIVGGGAAGFFLAIRLKELRPGAEVVILERGRDVLAKVRVSGGGRCNCTNTFEGVGDLAEAYPRGHRLMRRLFHTFGPADARQWFETHGVRLVAQPDHCVFPASQSSQTIVDCLSGLARRMGVEVRVGTRVDDAPGLLGEADAVAVCAGGMPQSGAQGWMGLDADEIVPAVPSLFSLSVADEGLHDLMGAVVCRATLSIAGTKLKACGDLLLTHWGMSGPAALRLSSYAARELHARGYKADLIVNWTSQTPDEALADLREMAESAPRKMVGNTHPAALPSRLWEFLVARALGDNRCRRWSELGKRDMNRLASTLTSTPVAMCGRAPFRDEFVTAGGVSLQSVDPKTLESKRHPGLFFAGEALDIDGVTGGFNFQAAWTTAFVAAGGMAARLG